MIEKILLVEFGKEGCDVCRNLEESIPKYIQAAGLDGRAKLIRYNLSKPSDEAIATALWYDVAIKNASVPTLVIDNGKKIWKKTVSYKDGKADLITAREVIPVLKEYASTK